MSTEMFLIKDVPGLGQEGDIVKVAEGYHAWQIVARHRNDEGIAAGCNQ